MRDEVEKVRVNAVIDMERKESLFIALSEERRSFTDWLRGQIDSHLRRRKTLEEEWRTSQMGLWRSADDHLKAASVVDKNLPNQTSITYFLYCRAIELFLKAYLRSRGIGLKPLIRLGHNLDALVKAVKREDAKFLEMFDADQLRAIRRINKFYEGKELEYILTGFKTYPTVEILQSSAESLSMATRKACTGGGG